MLSSGLTPMRASWMRPLRIEHKVTADNAHVALAPHFLLTPCSALLHDGMVGVREQLEWQRQLLPEPVQCVLRVRADAHYDYRGSVYTR
jgi:hypothetical protein